jgi:flavin reductase (DIM6/NTAB) family NADH-FMN oxidoreductase RutF
MSQPQEIAPSPTAAGEIGAALGRVPSGLFVISWRSDDRDRVMLASWVMQAGFEPPLVSLAVAPSREFLTAVRGGAPFVINALAASQRNLLARFGKPIAEGDDPFDGIPMHRIADDLAVIDGAASWLACRMVGEAMVNGADHVVVVARVETAGGTAAVEPLVHIRKNGLRY